MCLLPLILVNPTRYTSNISAIFAIFFMLYLKDKQNKKVLSIVAQFTITLSVQVQVEAKSIFCFLGAAGHIIRIFQDMHVLSHKYLSG